MISGFGIGMKLECTSVSSRSISKVFKWAFEGGFSPKKFPIYLWKSCTWFSAVYIGFEGTKVD